MIEVSIVSHGHGGMVERLVSQLLEFPAVQRVILTLNLPERVAFRGHPKVLLIENAQPKGFGANHNAAFGQSHAQYFCILNPDIEFRSDPFGELLQCHQHTQAGIVAPLILNPGGGIEDSARYFPTLFGLIKKILRLDDGRFPLKSDNQPWSPDWVAGMFMLMTSTVFERLGGFDERYFLYYEDVDLCRRVRQLGMSIVVCPTASAIHDARRDSHRKLKHLRWHLASMARYLCPFGKRQISSCVGSGRPPSKT